MQLSLSIITPLTPLAFNWTKSSAAMEGTLRVGLRMVGLTMAESEAEMPAKFIGTESWGGCMRLWGQRDWSAGR